MASQISSVHRLYFLFHGFGVALALVAKAQARYSSPLKFPQVFCALIAETAAGGHSLSFRYCKSM